MKDRFYNEVTIEQLIKYIPQEVKNLLQQVGGLSTGYKVYLGGGYLRDMYIAVLNGHYSVGGEVYFSPKDIDLVFIPTSENGVLPILPKSYCNYNIEADEVSPDMAKRGVTRLMGIFVPDLTTTTEVQYIVYGKYMTIQEVAADFDCNINQVMYNPSERWYHTEAFETGHENQVIELLHTFEEKRMISRLVRMKRKLGYEVKSDLDWESCYNNISYEPERGGSMVGEEG